MCVLGEEAKERQGRNEKLRVSERERENESVKAVEAV